MNYQPISLSQAQVQQFQTDGFLIVGNFVFSDFAKRLAERMESLNFFDENPANDVPPSVSKQPCCS